MCPGMSHMFTGFGSKFHTGVQASRDLAKFGKWGRGVGGPPGGREVGSHLGETGGERAENGRVEPYL